MTFFLLFHNVKRELGRDLSYVFFSGYLGLWSIPCTCPCPQLELIDDEEDLLIFCLASGAVVFKDPLKVFDP